MSSLPVPGFHIRSLELFLSMSHWRVFLSLLKSCQMSGKDRWDIERPAYRTFSHNMKKDHEEEVGALQSRNKLL